MALFSIVAGKDAPPTNSVEGRLVIVYNTGELYYETATSATAILNTNRFRIGGIGGSGSGSSSDLEAAVEALQNQVDALPTISSGTSVPDSTIQTDYYVQYEE